MDVCVCVCGWVGGGLAMSATALAGLPCPSSYPYLCSKEEVRMIQRIRKGQFPHVEVRAPLAPAPLTFRRRRKRRCQSVRCRCSAGGPLLGLSTHIHPPTLPPLG